MMSFWQVLNQFWTGFEVQNALKWPTSSFWPKLKLRHHFNDEFSSSMCLKIFEKFWKLAFFRPKTLAQIFRCRKSCPDGWNHFFTKFFKTFQEFYENFHDFDMKIHQNSWKFHEFLDFYQNLNQTVKTGLNFQSWKFQMRWKSSKFIKFHVKIINF
jgi:hypothetical protein